MTTTEMWDRLEKTDPAHTKPFKRGGGFAGTAINSTYVLKRLTKEFGPCGKGWRFVVDDEKIVDGHLLKNAVDHAKVHIIRGHLEYLMEGTWLATSPQFGQTMLVDDNKYGAFTDEEAPKKSITDCIAKCAVLLGIGADIHLGLFDDNKYVNQRKREEAEGGAGQPHPAQAAPPANAAEPRGEQSAPPDSAVIQFLKGKNLAIPVPGQRAGKSDHDAWALAFKKAIGACTDKRTLDKLWQDNCVVIDQIAQFNGAMRHDIEVSADDRQRDLTPPATLAAE